MTDKDGNELGAGADVKYKADYQFKSDFKTKPPDLNRLLITIRNAIDRGSLATEAKVLRRKVSKVQDMIGESVTIKKIKETI